MQTQTFPKILQLGKFYPPDIGGIESVMQDITQGITQKGLVCDVLCSNSRLSFSYEILKPHCRIYRTKSFGKLASTSISPQMIFFLQKLIHAYDIIHIHLPDPMANLALFCANLKDKILIAHWHSDIIKQKYLLKLYTPLQSWLLKRVDSIIGTSPKYIEQSRFLQPYKHKCISIPIGINIASIHQGLAPKRTEKKIIFALGRLAQNKGFEYLIQSAQYLSDEYIIHIGGDGVLKNKLTQLIARLHLQKKVILLGAIPREQLHFYYAQCQIFVLSSIQESYGVVLLEAMSFGKPVISTKLTPSGSDWVNQHGYSGLVVPPRNPQAIANAVLEIEKNYAFFSNNAKSRFMAYFTQEKMIDSLYNLYMQIYEAKSAVGGGCM